MMRNVRKRAVLGLLFVTLAGCGLFITPERRIERATAYAADGDWGSAVIELRQALESQPDNLQGRLLLARVSYQVGDLFGAEKELQRAVELKATSEQTAALGADIDLALGKFKPVAARMAQPVPGLAEAERLTYQGYGLLGLGQTGDAMSAFRAALVTDPSPEQALRARAGLAQGYAQDGQLDAAIAELDAVLAKDKNFALASVWKGALLAQQGKAAEAEQLLLDAGLASRQTSLPAMQRVTGLAALAEAQFAQSKLDAVEQTVMQMKEIAPRVLIASYLGARLALARNDAPAAVIEMQRVVQAAPELAAGRFLLAQALAATGNYGQAETELQVVVTAEPDNIEARKLLADMQIRAGRPDAAAESLFPALRANSTDPQVYSLFGRAKFESGDRDTAAMFWERSLAQAPEDSRLKLSLAADYIGSGQSQRALDLLATVPDAEGGKQKKQMQLIAMAAGKDPARASEEIAALVARNAGDLELRNLAAVWHTSRGEFDQARAYLDAALKQQPDDLPTLINMARLQASAQQFDDATATLERALKVKSDSGPVLLGLSQVATAKGDTAAAKRWLEEWRKRDPTSAEARLLLAQQALAQRDTKGGNQLIEEALQAAPKQAGVANAAGQVLLEAGRYDEALRRFREAIELSPEMPELHYNAARAQIALNQREAARESLNKTLSLRSDWPPALVLLAQLDARAGRFDAALAGAAKLKQSVQPAAGFMLEGEVRSGMREFAAAEKAFAEAARLRPTQQAAVARHKARRDGKLPQPEQPLLDWLAANPQDVPARFALAEWRQAQGDFKGAIREYERLNEQTPGKAVLQNNLAWLYGETGDPRAESMAAAAYKAAPDAWAIADTYGWILVSLGKVQEALEILKQAYEKSGDNPEVAYHLGVAHAKAGETGQARTLLAKAVAGAGAAAWKADAQRELDALK